MPILVNLLDALRKFGRPTQKSAIRRQDAQLEDMEVLDRGRVQLRTELGVAESFVARVCPAKEIVVPLSEEEVGPIRRNSARASDFLASYLERDVSSWSLDDLDLAFAAWINAEDKRGFEPDRVVQILGAAFGERCAQELKMRWVWIEDSDWKCIALQGVANDFRGFPFHSVEKRVADLEHGFFKSIFISLQSAARQSEVASPGDVSHV